MGRGIGCFMWICGRAPLTLMTRRVELAEPEFDLT